MEDVVKILCLLFNRCEHVVSEQFIRLFVHASRVVVGARDYYRHIEARGRLAPYCLRCPSERMHPPIKVLALMQTAYQLILWAGHKIAVRKRLLAVSPQPSWQDPAKERKSPWR